MSDKSDEEGPRLKAALRTIMNYNGNNEEDLRIANIVREAMVDYDFDDGDEDQSGGGEGDNANDNISYFDRIVFEAGGTADDVNIENNAAGEVMDGEETADDGSQWSMIEEDEEESDVEMDFDSDEESIHLQTVVIKMPNSATEGNLSEESKELLLWRLDKDENFSDWAIEVSVANNNEESNTKKTYHVHKSTLGLGPKKSGYFDALLKSGQFSESSNNTSVVELPSDIAAYFPDFLDYMYAQPSECKCIIKRDNRRALQYLAKYFLVTKLTEDINHFIEQDMQNLDQLEGYITEFVDASDDDESRKILALAALACAHKILRIGKDSTLLRSLPPAMVLHMIRTLRRSKNVWIGLGCRTQYQICELTIEYIKYHHASLDVNYFATLTSELYFPEDTNFAGKVAIRLLEIIELAGWEKDIDSDIKDVCTAILTQYLARLDKPTEEIMASRFKMIPKSVVLSLLANGYSLASISQKVKTSRGWSLSCKLISEISGRPVGSIVKVAVYPTDSIDYIRYQLNRQFNIVVPISIWKIFCNGEMLAGKTLIFDTSISSTTTLDVKWSEFGFG